MLPVTPLFTATMASAGPKSSVPVVLDGAMALEEAKSKVPLVLVKIVPSVIVRSPPLMTSELIAAVLGGYGVPDVM